jgi:PAS domain S-box-containing protein
MQQSLTPLKQAGICLALAALACWFTVLTWPISERFPFAFFLAAVVAAAWSCGPAASIFTTALCTAALGLIYYWHSLASSFELVQENLPRLGLFLFTGLLTSYLVRECRGAIRAVDRVHVMLGHLGEALITTDDQGMIRYVNEEAQTLTGCDAREAVGKPLGHVLNLLDERTCQPLPQPGQTVMARRVAVELPAGAVLQTSRGKGIAVEGRAAPIQEGGRIDGVAFTFRDVTRRRNQEQAEHHRLEQWQQAAAHLPDPVFLKDELGNYVGANSAAAKLVAREQQSIAGAEDAALFSPEVARDIIQADRLAFESGQPQCYQLAVGDGAERRIFNAVKTPIVGPDGKLSGLVDVFHEVTAAALNEEKLRKAHRDLERRLEEQAAVHKSSLEQLSRAHEKACAELHAVHENTQDSLNEQLAELRQRLDEKTIAHAEAESLLAALPDKHAQEFEEKLAAERAADELAWNAKFGKLEDEHATRLESAVQEERQKGGGLLQLAQQEHAQSLAEYQAAWEAAEEALQKANEELETLRNEPTQSADAIAAREERAELIRRVAEQTAARLGLEESLRRANEKIQKLKQTLAQPRELDQQQAEQIRRQVTHEFEQKIGESQTAWQRRLDLALGEHEQRFAAAQEFWRQLQADYERQLSEARDKHLEVVRHLQEQQARPAELDQHQVDEIRRLAETDLERKWHGERADWQQRLEQTAQEHDQRLRDAQNSWRQTLTDYDRRLTEARNQAAELESLRERLAQCQAHAQQAWREKELLAELLKARTAPATNGAASVSKAAYADWEGTAERANPDWLSFN